ncbi:MAG: hypothetical protein FWE82_07950, partial [Defluviitaleaceae bacterium]|nr:hypothetical protein [Defluviitaleaceae bacterium]
MDKNTVNAALMSGFNTYNNYSVFSHVLMPEGFAVNLGFKFYNTGRVLNDALIGRYGDHEEKIHPCGRTWDGGYTELFMKFSDCAVRVQSSADASGLVLLVTPLHEGAAPQVMPPVALVSAAVLWGRPGCVFKDGDKLVGSIDGKTVEVYSDGEITGERNVNINSPFFAVKLDRPVTVSTGRRISCKEAEAVMLKAKAASEKQLEKYGDQAEAAAAMRACMAWDTIYEPEQMQVCTPVSRLWNIGWGGYVLFCWDTYFAAMLAATENKELAYSNLIAITGEKTESGFVPNFGSSNDGKSRDRSQPPVGAKALKEVYRRYREKWIVEYLFDDLLVWNRWWAANRQIKNGTLCWGSNPYEIRRGMHWETTGVDELLGAALESGLDNSPMYDGMEFDKETHLMRLSDVGLTGLYIMDCEALADLAEEIGRSEAAELRKRAEHTKDGLDTLWCEDSGMFLNRRTDTGELSPRTSPANFYALYSNRVTEAQAKKMMKNYF